MIFPALKKTKKIQGILWITNLHLVSFPYEGLNFKSITIYARQNGKFEHDRQQQDVCNNNVNISILPPSPLVIFPIYSIFSYIQRRSNVRSSRTCLSSEVPHITKPYMLNIQYLNIITILLDSNHVKACIRFWQDYMMTYSTQKNKKKKRWERKWSNYWQ